MSRLLFPAVPLSLPEMFDGGGRDAPVLALGHDLPHHLLVLHVGLFDGGHPLPYVAPLGLEILELDPALVPGLLAALPGHLLAHVREHLPEAKQPAIVEALIVVSLRL